MARIVRNTAWQGGKTVTLMPKPLFGDNGSGMHVHQSLWKDGVPLFFGDGYGDLSEMARHYIGGLLKHAPSLLAFTNPTVNSYRRLVPGYEALNNLERDHEFLLKSGVFTKDLIDTWIDIKRKQEVDYVRLRPHPAEFELYFDL